MLSHLLAIAFTLLSMIAAVVFIVGTVLANQGVQLRQPASDARNVAGVISGLVETRADSAELSSVLRQLATGTLRMTVGFPDPRLRGSPFQFGLTNVDY